MYTIDYHVKIINQTSLSDFTAEKAELTLLEIEKHVTNSPLIGESKEAILTKVQKTQADYFAKYGTSFFSYFATKRIENLCLRIEHLVTVPSLPLDIFIIMVHHMDLCTLANFECVSKSMCLLTAPIWQKRAEKAGFNTALLKMGPKRYCTLFQQTFKRMYARSLANELLSPQRNKHPFSHIWKFAKGRIPYLYPLETKILILYIAKMASFPKEQPLSQGLKKWEIQLFVDYINDKKTAGIFTPIWSNLLAKIEDEFSATIT